MTRKYLDALCAYVRRHGFDASYTRPGVRHICIAWEGWFVATDGLTHWGRQYREIPATLTSARDFVS